MTEAKWHPATDNPATIHDAMQTAAEEAYDVWTRQPSFADDYGAAGPSEKDGFKAGYIAACEEWF